MQNRRYAVLAELKIVVAEILRKRRVSEEEERKKKEEKRLSCLRRFQANVRMHYAKQKFPDLIDSKRSEKKLKIEMIRNGSATKIQSLYRGYSIRIWIINIPIEDPKRMWFAVQQRKLLYLPSRIAQLQNQAEVIRQSFSAKLKPSQTKYRLKQRLWNNFRLNAERKVEKYEIAVRKYVLEVKKFKKYKNSEASVLRRSWERAKLALIKNEILREAKTAQILASKINDTFLETRIEDEYRRDAIITAEGLAIHNAMEVLNVEKKNLYFVFDKILDIEAETDEEVTHSDTDVHHDSSSEEDFPDDMDENEVQVLREENRRKKLAKVVQKQKEQAERRKKRIKRHEKLQKYKKHWLRKQKYKIGKLIEDVEDKRYELANHGLMSAINEMELYDVYNKSFMQIMESVRLQIQTIAENAWLRIESQRSEMIEGEGAQIHFESLTQSMRLHKKITIEKERILEITANISHLATKQILRREKFVVCDWMAAKKKMESKCSPG